MENLKTYEGWFNSKYKDIIDKLYNYILTMDLNGVQREGDYYIFHMGGKKNKDDPYGEENWADVEIKLDDYYNRVFINRDIVECTLFKKLNSLLKKRLKNKEQEEKDARIRAAINRL
jgi:hypothetical protein